MSEGIAEKYRDDMWHMLGVRPDCEWKPTRNFWSADIGQMPENMALLVATGLAEDRGERMGSRIFVLTAYGIEQAKRLHDEEVARRGIKEWRYRVEGLEPDDATSRWPGVCRGITRSKARYAVWCSIVDIYPDIPIMAVQIGPRVRSTAAFRCDRCNAFLISGSCSKHCRP